MKNYKLKIKYLGMIIYQWEGESKDLENAKKEMWCDFMNSAETIWEVPLYDFNEEVK